MTWWQAQANRSTSWIWIKRIWTNYFGYACHICGGRVNMVLRETIIRWKSHSEFVSLFKECWKCDGCNYGHQEWY